MQVAIQRRDGNNSFSWLLPVACVQWWSSYSGDDGRWRPDVSLNGTGFDTSMRPKDLRNTCRWTVGRPSIIDSHSWPTRLLPPSMKNNSSLLPCDTKARCISCIISMALESEFTHSRCVVWFILFFGLKKKERLWCSLVTAWGVVACCSLSCFVYRKKLPTARWPRVLIQLDFLQMTNSVNNEWHARNDLECICQRCHRKRYKSFWSDGNFSGVLSSRNHFVTL